MRSAFLCGVLLFASVAQAENRSFTLTARQFTFDVTPMPFEVNLGDVVTLTIDAADDGNGNSGHGFAMQTYHDTSTLTLHPGSPKTFQFTAHTPGEFIYFCTRVCGSGHNSMDGIFRVIGEAGPKITNFSPFSGPTSGGTQITITGTGFEDGATVTFGGIAAQSVEVDSGTRIIAVTPRGPFNTSAPQSATLVIRNPDGKTAQESFTWLVPAPSIQTITPSAGARGGGTLVTITGAGFSTAVGLTLTFGGAPATNITVIDAVTLTARTPAHASGRVDVAIATNKGSATRDNGFTYSSSRRRLVRR